MSGRFLVVSMAEFFVIYFNDEYYNDPAVVSGNSV